MFKCENERAPRIAITGGTGFVGRHVAARLGDARAVIVSRRTGAPIDDVERLTAAFQRCDVVVHCAGINRELRDQTFERVHMRGTTAVVEAARGAGVGKIVMLSFLRARPDCGSAYHETKWEAEQIIRSSGLDYTILKAGMIYGRGDHMIDHLSRLARTIPFAATVGMRERAISPVPIAEMVDVIVAAAEGRMSRQTVAVTGGETLLLSDAVRRVGDVVGRRMVVFPAPLAFHRVFAQVCEWTMTVPLVANAQMRMLAEGVTEATGPASDLPDDLRPRAPFDASAIRAALPDEGRFGCSDLRLPRHRISRGRAHAGAWS
ncbi:NAD(P)H-binding protein [Microbacterium sp. SSM24]|uniref:NAD(P)H-binding protein n=1 Tax=Microbacterium sp. SSM24 TaxID=2991714 RepID=UPI002226AC3C|nr:NAD(P)H-binding protein [Microbacterium sp. SSM24]MCW3493678.1 NAD(P)H-binding protein [Microbacterium sp. SSM24]